MTGQRAKDVIRRYFKTAAKPTAGELLYLLDQENLVVVARQHDTLARRGDNDLGPMLGRSHTANLIGGAS